MILNCKFFCILNSLFPIHCARKGKKVVNERVDRQTVVGKKIMIFSLLTSLSFLNSLYSTHIHLFIYIYRYLLSLPVAKGFVYSLHFYFFSILFSQLCLGPSVQLV